jgi:NTP pyrophosphatase (non-canonical NTP hydrolase)
MNRQPRIIEQILEELDRAKELHPDYPTDMMYQINILVEEVGELSKAANDYKSGDGEASDIIKEALQVGAMAIRFLENVKFERG